MKKEKIECESKLTNNVKIDNKNHKPKQKKRAVGGTQAANSNCWGKELSTFQIMTLH